MLVLLCWELDPDVPNGKQLRLSHSLQMLDVFKKESSGVLLYVSPLPACLSSEER